MTRNTTFADSITNQPINKYRLITDITNMLPASLNHTDLDT